MEVHRASRCHPGLHVLVGDSMRLCMRPERRLARATSGGAFRPTGRRFFDEKDEQAAQGQHCLLFVPAGELPSTHAMH